MYRMARSVILASLFLGPGVSFGKVMTKIVSKTTKGLQKQVRVRGVVHGPTCIILGQRNTFLARSASRRTPARSSSRLSTRSTTRPPSAAATSSAPGSPAARGGEVINMLCTTLYIPRLFSTVNNYTGPRVKMSVAARGLGHRRRRGRLRAPPGELPQRQEPEPHRVDPEFGST